MTTLFFDTYKAQYNEVVAWRRHLHQHPELSFFETKTAAFIEEKLRGFGLTDIRTNVGGKGIVATIHGANEGPTLAFRADFDALPIVDEKETAYTSTIKGVMHACGHDGHTANLLGLAYVLMQHTEALHGNVVLIFQHAEEKPPGGAKPMIEAGALDGVDYVFGAHLASELPVGKIASRKGPTMASVDAFKIHLQGRGGHGARPHQTVDSIAVGSRLVTHLQQIVSRRINPVEPAVVTIGRFHAGHAFNIIADTAEIEGTVRAMSHDVRIQLQQEIRAILEGMKHADHIDYTLEFTHGYPVLINTEAETALVASLAAQTFSEDASITKDIALGADDFAYFLEQRPGSYFFVGSNNDDPATQYPHHHPRFDFDERALLQMGEMFLAIVGYYLVK
ncbi:peptidase M20 [Kurthia sp. 3B1D]|uniref:Peptidase M20 n=1 Tax=Candidatus Kurthia intestinigallinarum TaxID=1562256 RepID=A0A433RVV2_9BACL|nr:amidohydrolase [Kurthia sp. 3B1D]RUS57426.1 peptidase M20 [Kurthia sp. 3B1D]